MNTTVRVFWICACGLVCSILVGIANSPAQAAAAKLGGSDLVFVAAQSNYVVLSMWTKKDSSIKALADLAGKTIGVSAPGSATHTIARLSLRKAGVADKDVKFVHHGALLRNFCVVG